ncbi:MAG: hypothetical protein NC320_06695 [Clostridium sp.]|nr:hypothetical protein [Clostridium sp.]MCM1547066.1 hypothetical protein [Ruminococcus sp.]
MNYFKLYIPSIIMIISCILLIRQCFKPYFIDPNKARNPNFILIRKKEINTIGKIFTIIAIIFTVYYFIIPVSKDTICIVNDDYIYSVVETRTSITNSSRKYGDVNLYVHPEFIYDPESEQIKYVSGSENENKQWHTFKISFPDYEKGEYYIVKYLPNTLYGIIICYIDDIEQYRN